VTSQLPVFVSHRSSAFFRVIRLICFVTQLTAVLHAGSQVSCHIFVASAYILAIDLGQEDRYVILLVDNLYAEAIDAVKSRVTLSASIPKLASNLGDISSEARL
jgi:hypothetical protein